MALRLAPPIVLLTLVAVLAPTLYADDFAYEVLECVPAPGQWTNHTSFNEPAKTLGAPSGGGTSSPDNSSIMSLGGFGGSIVLRFEETVTDDPGNYLGLDFIVFSNATWVSGDRQRKFGEPAHLEIMPDLDDDGIPGTAPGEVWYPIPGSILADDSTCRSQTWDDVADNEYPPDNTDWFPWIGTYPYLPEGPCVIPLDEYGRYTTSAYELPQDIYADPGGLWGVIVNPNVEDADEDNNHLEGYYGYAEMSPTLQLGDLDADNDPEYPEMPPGQFYTVPDNPFRVGITPGSGGGDAFDIAWAVDPATWQPANLTGFDFVRITNAVDIINGPLGEASPEIDAVADVRPVPCPGDLDGDGGVDLVDLIQLRNLADVEDPETGFTIPGDLEMDGRPAQRALVILRARYLG